MPTVVPVSPAEMNQVQIEIFNNLGQLKKDYSRLFEQIKELSVLLLISELDKNPQKKEEVGSEYQALRQKVDKEEKLTTQEEHRLAFLDKLFARYSKEDRKKLGLGELSKQIDNLVIEFGEKVVSGFSLMQRKAQAVGMELDNLPDFIKAEDIKLIMQVLKSSLHLFALSDTWLRRFLEVKKDTPPQELKEKLQAFIKAEISVRDDKDQLLVALQRFERGVLKEFNTYSRELKLAKKLIKSFEEYSDPAGNPFRVAVHTVLNRLNIISNTMVDQESAKFQRTEFYKNIPLERDKRNALIAHMKKFEEFLPVEQKIQFIERVLNSQKRAQFTGEDIESQKRQYKEDKAAFAPLFKNKQFIQKLSELHTVFKAIESAKVAYLEAEENANANDKSHQQEHKIDYRCAKYREQILKVPTEDENPNIKYIQRKSVKSRMSVIPVFASEQPQVSDENSEKEKVASTPSRKRTLFVMKENEVGCQFERGKRVKTRVNIASFFSSQQSDNDSRQEKKEVAAPSRKRTLEQPEDRGNHGCIRQKRKKAKADISSFFSGQPSMSDKTPAQEESKVFNSKTKLT
ncbi:hypothetical protein [Legionella jamestowniensis]|uniref:EbhA protein n=1 Tax=Legionella jamestowniensis TaxID=455 RepID=A0A0W0UZU9_9GAMM|nr:hypothetical protein [Legionella jamestowniensis]KTD13378.1 hypothetical protein Ljam_0168 [Legionella jamestowniensis]OCH98401.1 hypothetical protein A8135_12685 [Legionella jamestowniensis]SFL76266.1 hypothetical protein SAMN02746073_1758 [Legionella jamestowniensis DSM 19215]